MFASKDLFLTRPSGGYQISRSVRLRSSASAYLSKSYTSGTNPADTNNKIKTYSFWTKRGILGSTSEVLSNIFSTSNFWAIYFDTNNCLNVYDFAGGAATCNLVTTQVFRDPSAWYHIIVAVDTTQATASNRIKVYVNGVQVTSFSTATYMAQNAVSASFFTPAGGTWTGGIGALPTVGNYFDGYITELNVIDGQALTPSSFGQTNTVTGVWQPIKYTGTYGTNGFYLNFSDNSNNTATTIGKDYSGNGNNWTPNNISVTAGVTYDSFRDVPTPYADGSGGRGNYAVGNPLLINVTTSSTATLTNGNLLLTNGSATYSGFASTISIPTTGKWAWKFKVTGSVSGSNDGYIGFACNSSGSAVTGASSGAAANWFTTVQVQAVSDRGVVHKYAGGSVVTDAAGSGGTGATGDEWEFLIDRDAGTTIVKLNGTTKATVTGLPATQELFPFATFYQTSGYFVFDYTPSDTSYNPLNTQNLPTPTISNGATVMAASTYTGTGATQTIANSGNNAASISFKPDLVWIKSRSAATDHKLTDSVRGTTKALISDTTGAETTDTNGLTAFGTTGFTIGTDTNYNNNTATYVAWQWQAGAGSSSSNTSGSITSTVSVNATAGFSVVTYTGTGANATVGHGLGVAPKMVIVKDRSNAGNEWAVYHANLTSAAYYIVLNTTAAQALAGAWNSTAPTSSLFTVGGGSVTNQTSHTYVAYCFAAVAGYSAFGSYTGNGSTDGPFVFLGFRPRWVMIKRTDANENWQMYDTSRNTSNVVGEYLLANSSGAGATITVLDFLSNGFKIRVDGTNPGVNTSGGTYIYAAFAENPFKLSLAR